MKSSLIIIIYKFLSLIFLQIPETAFYFPNFISEEEEKNILDNVYSSPKPKWTYLSNRRLQNWGGIPHPKGMIPEKIPDVRFVFFFCELRLSVISSLLTLLFIIL